jgi:hypothetical protein
VQVDRFDRDGSGDISFDEFLPWWREVVADNQKVRELQLQNRSAIKRGAVGGKGGEGAAECSGKASRMRMWNSSELQQQNTRAAQQSYIELNRMKVCV